MKKKCIQILGILLTVLAGFVCSGFYGAGQAYADNTRPTQENRVKQLQSVTRLKTSVANEGIKHIRVVTREGHSVVFRLNNSPAAKALFNQLPLGIGVQDFARTEKIFYLPKKLDTTNTPMARGGTGTLAYYAPWGNVAMYYGKCHGANGLYALGEVVSGVEYLAGMKGNIEILK